MTAEKRISITTEDTKKTYHYYPENNDYSNSVPIYQIDMKIRKIWENSGEPHGNYSNITIHVEENTLLKSNIHVPGFYRDSKETEALESAGELAIKLLDMLGVSFNG